MTEQSEQPSALTLPTGELSNLSPTVAAAYGNMPDESRDIFWAEYSKKRRSTAVMVVLAVLFPIQFFFLRKTGLGIAYLLTGGFLGLGWIVFWFVTPLMVRDYNDEIANEIVRNVRNATRM